jgi:two-component system, OmpR family, response regulator QseB
MLTRDPSSKLRILLVEDERISRDALHRLLALSGFEVASVGMVAAALAWLDQHACDCVIVDLMLPDGAGTTVLQRVRSNGSYIRVAVATGTDDPALLAEARRLRPDGFFEKPISLAKLTAWLNGD